MGKRTALVIMVAGVAAFAMATPAQAAPAAPAATKKGCSSNGNVCLVMKTSVPSKNHVKVKSATVELLGIASNATVTFKYYGGGKPTKKHTKLCDILCAYQFSPVNYTYKKGTKVCGAAILSGVNEGVACVKL
jgi:hypothetical protein